MKPGGLPTADSIPPPTASIFRARCRASARLVSAGWSTQTAQQLSTF